MREAPDPEVYEVTARCYETMIEVWSAGVVHKHPVIELFLERHGVVVNIADEYPHLRAMLERLIEKLAEHEAADRSAPPDASEPTNQHRTRGAL